MADENLFSKLHASILAQPIKARDDVADQRRQAEVTRQRIEAFKRSLGIRYARCCLDTFRVSDDGTIKNAQLAALSLLQSFVDELLEAVRTGSGLFLYGPVGTGKDHLLASVMIEAVNRDVTVSWMNGLDIFATARDAISEDAGEAALFDRLTTPTVLAISDPLPPIGDVSTFQRSLLLRAIDKRYRCGKPTWITMNVSNRAEAEKRLGVQLLDRLLDGALSLVCNWPSYRESRRWTPKDND